MAWDAQQVIRERCLLMVSRDMHGVLHAQTVAADLTVLL